MDTVMGLTNRSMTGINGMRHAGIHDPMMYNDKRVALIGVGTIGSWLAHILARMQVPIDMYDHDTVEAHNLATQTYGVNDIGQPKVSAVINQINAIDQTHQHFGFDVKFQCTDNERYAVIVCAVDSLEARKEIAQQLIEAGVNDPIIDGRVGREQVEVYYFDDAVAWLAQLPDEGDTDPCGARFTAYAAVEAAGLMANNVKRVLLGQPIHAWRVIFDNASMTFISENNLNPQKHD